MPHTRQTRARPYALPVEGEVAWRIVSPSWALKGGWAQAVQASHARAQLPWSTRPAFRVSGLAHGPGERAGAVASPPGQQRGTPHARSRDGRPGCRAHGTAGRALRPAADGTRPRSSAVPKTARVSSTHVCSPLQSLCELLARDLYRNLLCMHLDTSCEYYTQSGIQSNVRDYRVNGAEWRGFQ